MMTGYKTYVLAVLIAVATGAKFMGYLDDSMYQTLLALLGAGTAASLRASVSGVDKKLLIPLFLLLFSINAFAQTPATNGYKYVWDQPAAALADAQGYTYKTYLDGSLTGTVITSVTCVAGTTAGLFTCQAPIPAITPGNHSVTLTATDAVSGESGKSVPLDFKFVVVPNPPTGLRISK